MSKYILVLFLLFFTGCDDLENLPYGYQYVSENMTNTVISNGYGKTAISCMVLDYKYNDQYLIAKQAYYPYGNDLNQCFSTTITENIYKQEKGKIYYWLIDMKNDILFGPYSKKNLLNQKLKQYHINDIKF